MTYIATEDIRLSRGVLAYYKGEVVPESIVKNLGIQDKVASERTKAAQEAVKDVAKQA